MFEIIKNMFFPSMTGTQAQISVLNTVLSKRGKTTRLEVLLIFGFKVVQWLFTISIVLGILFGWIDVWSLVKIITTNKFLN